MIERLLSSEEILFDSTVRTKLLGEPGLYTIYVRETAEHLRAGRADSAAGIRQRVYTGHFMGSSFSTPEAPDSLRGNLVRSGICPSLEEAKSWMRDNCAVRALVVGDFNERRWGEHFMLSVLRPRFGETRGSRPQRRS